MLVPLGYMREKASNSSWIGTGQVAASEIIVIMLGDVDPVNGSSETITIRRNYSNNLKPWVVCKWWESRTNSCESGFSSIEEATFEEVLKEVEKGSDITVFPQPPSREVEDGLEVIDTVMNAFESGEMKLEDIGRILAEVYEEEEDK